MVTQKGRNRRDSAGAKAERRRTSSRGTNGDGVKGKGSDSTDTKVSKQDSGKVLNGAAKGSVNAKENKNNNDKIKNSPNSKKVVKGSDNPKTVKNGDIPTTKKGKIVNDDEKDKIKTKTGDKKVQKSKKNRMKSNDEISDKTNKKAVGKSKVAPSEPLPRSMYIVFVSLVLDLLAFTVILPLLPSLLEYYGNNDQGGLYHRILTHVHTFRDLVGAPDTPRWNAVLFGGVIGSLFSFLQYLTSPLFGAASDVYGRRPVLLVSLIGVVCSYVVWAVSHNFGIFVIARFIGGISKGNIGLCTAIATDVTSTKNRSKAMALIGIAFSIGFLIGPLIGAVFASYARQSDHSFYTPPAIFALVMAVADLLFIGAFFTETLPRVKRDKSLTSQLSNVLQLLNPVSLFNFSAVHIKNVSDVTSLRRIGLTYFLYLFCFSGVEFTLTFLFHNRFSYNSMQQGMMFCYTGVIMIVTQGGYVRRMKVGAERNTARMAMLIQLPAFIIMGTAQHLVIMYAGLLLYSFAAGAVVPCLTSLASTYGQPNQKGAVLGIFRSLGALARALAPVCACTLYWSYGPIVCYTAAGIALVLPIYLLHTLPTQNGTKTTKRD